MGGWFTEAYCFAAPEDMTTVYRTLKELSRLRWAPYNLSRLTSMLRHQKTMRSHSLQSTGAN